MAFEMFSAAFENTGFHIKDDLKGAVEKSVLFENTTVNQL